MLSLWVDICCRKEISPPLVLSRETKEHWGSISLWCSARRSKTDDKMWLNLQDKVQFNWFHSKLHWRYCHCRHYRLIESLLFNLELNERENYKPGERLSEWLLFIIDYLTSAPLLRAHQYRLSLTQRNKKKSITNKYMSQTFMNKYNKSWTAKIFF